MTQSRSWLDRLAGHKGPQHRVRAYDKSTLLSSGDTHTTVNLTGHSNRTVKWCSWSGRGRPYQQDSRSRRNEGRGGVVVIPRMYSTRYRAGNRRSTLELAEGIGASWDVLLRRALPIRDARRALDWLLQKGRSREGWMCGGSRWDCVSDSGRLPGVKQCPLMGEVGPPHCCRSFVILMRRHVIQTR